MSPPETSYPSSEQERSEYPRLRDESEKEGIEMIRSNPERHGAFASAKTDLQPEKNAPEMLQLQPLELQPLQLQPLELR